MEVPYTTKTKTRPSSQGLDYLRAPEVDFSGITRGLNILAQAAENSEERSRVEKEQSRRFQAYGAFNDFQIKVDDTFSQLQQSSKPDTGNFEETWEGIYNNLEDEFVSSQAPDMQQEFRMRAGDIRRRAVAAGRQFGTAQRRQFSLDRIEDQLNKSAVIVKDDPESMQDQEKSLYEYIDLAPGLSALEKEEKKRELGRRLQAIKYQWENKNGTTTRPLGFAEEEPPVPDNAVETGNIDLRARPVVRNKDGSISTLRSISMQEQIIDPDTGRATIVEVLIPTVREDGRYMTDDEAVQHYLSTDKHLGKFKTEKEATEFAKTLSDWEGKFQSGELKKTKAAPVGNHAQVIKDKAAQLGIDPFELALVISYETGGKFSPNIRGGDTGRRLGLIQFGDVEAAKYGVHEGQSFEEQMESVYNYLKDRGVKPGMGLADIYSTINAGSPGLYERSDRPGENILTHVARMSNPKDYRYMKAKALMGGDIDLSGIDSDPQYSLLSLEDRLALRKDAQAEAATEWAALQKAQEEERKTKLNTLFIGLSEGPMGQIQQEYDDAVESGLLNNYEDRAKAKQIMKERADENKYARTGVAKLATMGRGGYAYFAPNDEEHNKELNAVIGPDGLVKIAASDDNYLHNYLVPLIRTAHVVPENVSGALNAMVRSRDPRKALWALEAWSVIQDQDPAAFDQRTDDRTAGTINFWRAKRQYYTQEQLLEQITGGRTQEERQAHQMLRDEGEKIIKERKEVSALDYIEHWDSVFSDAPVLNQVPWASVEMGRDYNAVFVEEYSRYGDIDEAKEATNKLMDRIWGVTEIGGLKTLMKYPPEKVGYLPVNGDMTWIDRQVRNEYNIPPDHEFQLLSDKKTEQEFALWQKGKGANPPSYNVVIRGPDRAWKPAKSPNGKDARIYFQVTPEEEAVAEKAFDLKNLQDEFADFMNNTYLPAYRSGIRLGKDVTDELTQRKVDFEKRLNLNKTAVENAQQTIGTGTRTEVPPYVKRRAPQPDDPGMQPLYIPGITNAPN